MSNSVSKKIKFSNAESGTDNGSEFDNVTSALPKIAIVHQLNSEGSIFVLLENRILPVVGYLTIIPGIVPKLKPGQQVLVLETGQGVGILGCWQAAGEQTKAHIDLQNGNLRLDATESITLKTGASSIEVHANGKIRVDGKDIYSIAEGPLRLQGSIIELN
ncbi:MAG: hypothetical protein ACC635_00980 [Acidiferrobacterales bacterium]